MEGLIIVVDMPMQMIDEFYFPISQHFQVFHFTPYHCLLVFSSPVHIVIISHLSVFENP